MKLKCTPEDFQVVEQVALQPQGGKFALYTLTKQSLGTPEALAAIERRWGLGRGQIAFAGLKDRHALTRQYVTIEQGPRRELKQTSFELKYVGQTDRPIHASDITSNRFVVVLRDLSPEDSFEATSALKQAAEDGLPNYFDEQRFGSLGESGEFIGKPWCLGDYERALWLIIADPNVHDRPEERQRKGLMRKHWSDWQTCRKLLDDSPHRNIVNFLAGNPRDFRRAITMVRQDIRSLYLAAFQSDLWNAVLDSLIRQTCREDQLTLQTIGRREVALFRDLDHNQRAALAGANIPLPSARLHEAGPLRPLIDQALAAEGMELRQVRVKYPRDSFFSKGARPALFRARAIAHQGEEDDLFPQRGKLTLEFELPRGAYATILVKRIAGKAFDLAAEEETSEE